MNGILMIAAATVFLAAYILAIGVVFWRWGWMYGLLVFGGGTWLLSKYITMAIMVFVMTFAAVKLQGMLKNMNVKVTA